MREQGKFEESLKGLKSYIRETEEKVISLKTSLEQDYQQDFKYQMEMETKKVADRKEVIENEIRGSLAV